MQYVGEKKACGRLPVKKSFHKKGKRHSLCVINTRNKTFNDKQGSAKKHLSTGLTSRTQTKFCTFKPRTHLTRSLSHPTKSYVNEHINISRFAKETVLEDIFSSSHFLAVYFSKAKTNLSIG